MRVIDADKLKDHVEYACLQNEDTEPYIKWFNRLIDAEPTVMGEWIEVTNGRGGHKCSICGEYAPCYQNGDEWLGRHCVYCGIDMKKVTE